jgi:hypothetical protein
MHPTCILLHKLGFSRELGYAAISQTLVAEVGNHDPACLLSLNAHLRDERFDATRP